LKKNTVLSSKKRGKLLIAVAILFSVSISIGLVVFYLQFSSTGRVMQHVSPPTSSSIFVSPDKVVKQFYGDIVANNYHDAYTLLSTSARQSLDPVGGATYLEQLMRAFMNKYGSVMNYTIESQVKNSSTETIITLMIYRAKFSAAQTEKDTCTAIFNGQSWVIDHWDSDVTNGHS
jgi:hypothetical protein